MATGVADAAAELATQWLRQAFPERRGVWRIRPLGEPKAVADSPLRFAARDEAGVPWAIVFVSSRRSPGLVMRAAERASAARELLGDEVGAAVLGPMRSGWVDGLSVAAYPWRLETGHGFVRSRIRRPFVRAWAVSWLRGVVEACGARCVEPRDEQECIGILENLAGCSALGSEVRAEVAGGIRRLREGAWRPRAVLDHNDLWSGNIMVNRDGLARRAGTARYVVIDWAGANLQGGGFVDLVRVARSLQLNGAALQREIRWHMGVLGLDAADVIPQALLSLGWLYQHLEFFPVERFARLSEETCQRLRQGMT